MATSPFLKEITSANERELQWPGNTHLGHAQAGTARVASELRLFAGRLATGRLCLDDVWLILPLLIIPTILNFAQIYPNDFWWHLRTGQIIVQTGAIPTADLFTFSRTGFPWINQSWLMQSAIFLLHQAGGLPLVILMHSATITAGYLSVEFACLQAARGSRRAAALATIAAATAGAANWGVRPQDISFTFFGLLVFIIEKHRRHGTKAIWLLPPLFALWVNAHGGFVFGLGLLALYTAARLAEDFRERRGLAPQTRSLLCAAFISALALCLNPGGPIGILQYVAGFFRSKVTQNLNIEFLPLTIRETDGFLFVAATLVFLIVLIRRRAGLSAYAATGMLAFGLFALYSRRVAPWYGMVLAPVFAQSIVQSSTGTPSGASSRPYESGKLNYLLGGLLLAVALASLPWLRPYWPLTSDQRSYIAVAETPVDAARELCRGVSDTRIYNDIGYGSYLAWVCPSMPIFMDTRFELYPTEMWDDYMLIGHGQYGWDEKLRQYGINTIMAHKINQETLVAAAKASGGWRVLYEDKHSALLQRTSP